MRTREMNFMDHGVFPGDEKTLKQYCKSLSADERILLFQSAISAAPGLEIAIYDSIVTGDGYRTLERRGRKILVQEDDFYAYRRKTLALFYDMMRLLGRWK